MGRVEISCAWKFGLTVHLVLIVVLRDPNYLSPEAIAAAGTTTSWSEDLKKAEINLSLKKSVTEVDEEIQR
jgi:hypothetical protein